MNDFDEDGSSIILSQLHQQEIEEIQSTVSELTKENLKSGLNINISSLLEMSNNIKERLIDILWLWVTFTFNYRKPRERTHPD